MDLDKLYQDYKKTRLAYTSVRRDAENAVLEGLIHAVKELQRSTPPGQTVATPARTGKAA